MGGLRSDLQLAARMLAKDRRFTLAAIVALGLGIGVNTTVFALINGIVLRDMPFDEPDRLLTVHTRDAQAEPSRLSYLEFRDIRDAARSFSGLAAYADGVMNVSEEGHPPERFRGAYVSADTFGILRTRPVAGRDFLPADDQPGAPAVAIIGYRVWQSRYGGDATVIGKTVRVNAVLATVVGVMPAGFKYPALAEIWQPLSHWPGAANTRRDARTLGVVGRLRDNGTIAQASAEIETIAARLVREYAAKNIGIAGVVRPLKEMRPEPPTPILVAMIGAVVFVLLIAYANLANLLLARSVARAREIAIRTAVGATQWRIVRQLLIECGVLAMLGGALGFVLSIYGINQVALATDIIEPGAVPGTTRAYWYDFTPNTLVFAFTAALSVVSALAFGLIPAWHIARINAHDTLKDTGRSGGGGVRARRWTSALLTAELALTLILLTGAGLLWRSFVTHYNADVVIDPANVVTMRLALPEQQYPTPNARRAFFDRLNERLKSIAAFSAVTLASHAPMEFGGPPRELSIDGRTRIPDQKPPMVTYVLTGRGYFDALKLPIVQGRGFTPADAVIGERGAIVDQRFVSRFFANENPIGRRIQLGDTWVTVVGVASTIPQAGPPELVRPVVYAPFDSDPAPDTRAVVIVKGDLTAATRALREEMRAVDPNLPLFGIETLDTAIARLRFPVRLVGTWFGVLALVALVLASVGLYALTAHSVAQRVQEIGIRMALGAQARQVVWLFMRHTVVQLSIGLSLGLAGAFGAGRLLQAFLRNTSPSDAITLAVVTLVLVLVAGAATLIPARRAARVDPMVALRTE